VQRRILVVALTAVAVAVTLLGAPLAFRQRQYLFTEERAELVTSAAQIAITVPRDLHDGVKPRIDEALLADDDIVIAVYDERGRLLTGSGPVKGDYVVREAIRTQHKIDGGSDVELVSALPVMRGDGVAAVVRAASERRDLRVREVLTLGVVLGAAVFAALLAMLLALRLAWRLATPIRELTVAAEELGEGNFASRAPASGIAELDAVAASMNATASRLGQLVDRERAFVSHASHQLRTPLTALRLRLDAALHGPPETVRPAAAEAMAIVNDLEATVEDLLAVSRGRAAAVSALDLDRLLAGLPQRWEELLAAEGRRLVIRSDDPPVGAGRAATVRQVLDVLIDNAYRHGGGTVEVIARDASGALAIDVVDEGRAGASTSVTAQFTRVGTGDGATTGPVATTPRSPVPGMPVQSGPVEQVGRRAGRSRSRRGGTGIGLGLARSLVVADGGRLLLSSTPGRTCATVLLPPADAENDPAADGAGTR
jgi:signal transduction histidine kinase